MNKITTPSKVLNPAYRKINITRIEINKFKSSLLECLEHIKRSDDKNESEENIKKYIGDFLQNSFYQNYLINTKDRVDLAIYGGKDATSSISVLIEAKRPSNKSEFLKRDDINKKALQELLLYYLRERIEENNNQIKHLIATNGYEWYFFKGEDFYAFFYKNKNLIKEYNEFVSGQKDSSKNELFYNEIAKKYIEEVKDELPFLYIDIKNDYENLLPLSNTQDDELVSLYKVFSPIHLLAQSYGNDSNELNSAFYFELLHIIGLEEVQQKGIKLIERKKKKDRNHGSLLETTIFILEDRNYLKKVINLENYGQNKEEQLFNIALELCLTWINRILFLKLLEAQLVVYNKSKEYEFLNTDFISRFNDLEDLFFSALAKKPEERNEERIKEKYKNIPYLNSSLFEPNELEESTLRISSINGVELELYDKTVLKDDLKNNLQRLTGKIPLLSYIFRFLDAYDFSGKDQNKVDESNQAKALISAAVLGLIFEKINGYKEGSFYTPAYITMYMTKEVLRRTVLEKFNAQYGWDSTNFDYLKEDFYRYMRNGDRETIRKEANQIINSIKICDPAVGSGHFLVSALNELIVIKSELSLLTDKNGKRVIIYIKIENDELIVEDYNNEIFTYRPKNELSQTIQETLFHEKQILIESCLFGVDVNPNSVKICRLRLWIELLKNAYYTNYKEHRELQTLPNIDINIKTGNSLISKFNVDDTMNFFGNSLSVLVKKRIPDYKIQTELYKSVRDKEAKWVINKKLEEHRLWFDKLRSPKDKEYVELQKLNNDFTSYGMSTLADPTILDEMAKKIKEAEASYDKKMEIYRKSFEWRFAFPEVLDDEGKFIGFDIVIGNPPYYDIKRLEQRFAKYYLANYETAQNRINLYSIFIEKALSLLNEKGISSFIVPNSLLVNSSYSETRKMLFDGIYKLVKLPDDVFDKAIVETIIFEYQNNTKQENIELIKYANNEAVTSINNKEINILSKEIWLQQDYLTFNVYINEKIASILKKLHLSDGLFGETMSFSLGITPYDKYAGHDEKTIQERKFHSTTKLDKNYKPLISGANILKYAITENIKEYINYGNWLGAKREEKFFTSPRIIVRQILSGEFPQIYAGYTDNSLYFTQIGFSIIPKEEFNIQPKYVVALLNSKAYTFLHKYLYTDIEKNLFQKILIANCKRFPIKYKNVNQDIFVDLVNQILKSKKSNPNADTTDLENQIDILVYKLYELTYEEVLIIDSDFELSEEEYKK